MKSVTPVNNALSALTLRSFEAPGFLTSLKTELLDCTWWRSTYRLLAPLAYVTNVPTGNPRLLYIPSDFVTDLASVPRLPLVFFLVGNIGHESAVVHDWLYRQQVYPRDVCDKIFYEALLANNNQDVLAYMMYMGVRVGGGPTFNKYASVLKEVEESEKHHRVQ